jgi:uncharacterized protein (DUF1697 family)
MEWSKGVAFVKGINFYKNNRIRKEQMFKLCRSIESDDLKILGIVKTDNIIFKKRNMLHYATVSKKLEKVLSEHFQKQIQVTSRSMRTLRSIEG